MNTTTPTSVLWKQVWGLAILQSSITFSWTVYYFAQPVVLDAYFAKPVGLDADGSALLLGALLITSGLLSLLVEPVVGFYSDRIQARVGNRFGLINIGVVATAMIFMTVALGLRLPIPPALAFVVPLLMVLWMASMKIFQTPAISLLWRCAPPEELAKANSILVLIIGLVGAINPFVPTMVGLFGDSLTFVLGGVLLVIAATLMKRMTSTFAENTIGSVEEDSGTTSNQQLGIIFLIGFCASLATTPVYYIASGAIQAELLTSMKFEYVQAIILLVTALAAIPLGRWSQQVGIDRSLIIGLGAMAFFYILTSLPYGLTGGAAIGVAALLIIGIGVGTALVYNAGIPYALSNVTGKQASFAPGLFFGGGGLAFALIQVLNLTVEGGATISHMAIGSIIGLALAVMGMRMMNQGDDSSLK